jgi:anti-sigma factor RsiW
MLAMAAKSDGHFDEEAEQIEEHLLICEACRRRVAESDKYVAAMRRAAKKLRRAD